MRYRASRRITSTGCSSPGRRTMTVSIMDGHTGKDHVTSDDWAAFNAATYGNQGAVLGSGSFKLTM